MKPESLHALLIDRELGELTPETIELLEAWLSEHPESAGAGPAIHRTLETARAAIRRFPELARLEPPHAANVIALPDLRAWLSPLAWAAAVLISLSGSAWLGFQAGQGSTRKALAGHDHRPPPAPIVKHGGPWARYALASDPRGGLTVVRRDSNPLP